MKTTAPILDRLWPASPALRPHWRRPAAPRPQRRRGRWPARSELLASSLPGYDSTTGLPVFTPANGLPAMGCVPPPPCPSSCNDIEWVSAVTIDLTTLVPCEAAQPCPNPPTSVTVADPSNFVLNYEPPGEFCQWRSSTYQYLFAPFFCSVSPAITFLGCAIVASCSGGIWTFNLLIEQFDNGAPCIIFNSFLTKVIADPRGTYLTDGVGPTPGPIVIS